jgi:creatinine amidohydrolase/Fe(II)-dependent formamide hydrolase-like protein
MPSSLPAASPPNLRPVDELSYPELEALGRDRTLCVCAVSALEVHGPHLPIGSDLHQACWLADETGRAFAVRHPDWTVLRYPPLPLGTDELPLAGSVNTPARVVYRAVRAFGEQLARAGFRYVVLMNAHGGPRHAAALEAACRRVSRKRGIAMFSPSIRALHRLVSGREMERVEAFIGRKLDEAERHGLVSGEHAGTWETSWYLARHPELVAPEYKTLGEDHPPRFAPLERLANRLGARRAGTAQAGDTSTEQILLSLASGIGWWLNARRGYGRDGSRVTYSGVPAVAARDIGEAYATLPVEMCLEDLEAVTEGRLDPLEVKSIASDVFVIQPWFPRAVGVVLAGLVLLGAWLLL